MTVFLLNPLECRWCCWTFVHLPYFTLLFLKVAGFKFIQVVSLFSTLDWRQDLCVRSDLVLELGQTLYTDCLVCMWGNRFHQRCCVMGRCGVCMDLLCIIGVFATKDHHARIHADHTPIGVFAGNLQSHPRCMKGLRMQRVTPL